MSSDRIPTNRKKIRKDLPDETYPDLARENRGFLGLREEEDPQRAIDSGLYRIR